MNMCEVSSAVLIIIFSSFIHQSGGSNETITTTAEPLSMSTTTEPLPTTTTTEPLPATTTTEPLPTTTTTKPVCDSWEYDPVYDADYEYRCFAPLIINNSRASNDEACGTYGGEAVALASISNMHLSYYKTSLVAVVGLIDDLLQSSLDSIVGYSMLDSKGHYNCIYLISGEDPIPAAGSICDDDDEMGYICKRSAGPRLKADCDFENTLCWWQQATSDDFDWLLEEGETHSVETGPSGDHTTGTGYYAYIETSKPRLLNDTAQIISPLLDSTNGTYMSFWYHMYGIDVERLNLYIKDSTSSDTQTPTLAWSQNGTQGDEWMCAQVNIVMKNPYRLIFEGVRGIDFKGDIAIDDIKLPYSACPPAEDTTTTTTPDPTTTTPDATTTTTEPLFTTTTEAPPTTTTTESLPTTTTTELKTTTTTTPDPTTTTTEPFSTTTTTEPPPTTTTTEPLPTTVTDVEITTKLYVTTTEQLIEYTTPSPDEVLSSLGLSNKTNTDDILNALNDQLGENSTVSNSQLLGFGSLLSSTSSEVNDLSEMSSLLETTERVLELGLTGSTSEVASVAQSVVGVLGNAFSSANQQANTTGNNTQGNQAQVENIVESTVLLAEKIGSALTSRLTSNDKPIQISSDQFGMSVSVSDPGSSTGATMNTGFGTIALGDNPTGSSVPLQAMGFSSNPHTYAKNANETAVDVSPISFKIVGGSNQTVNYTAASPVNKTIPADVFDAGNITGTDGVLSQYKIEDLYSFMQIVLLIPDDGRDYTVRCNLNSPPNITNRNTEIQINDTENITVNQYNADISFNVTTGSLTIFVNSRIVNETGFLFIRITSPQNPSTTMSNRRKRAAGSSSFSVSAAVYAPRVWDEDKKEWVVSDDVQIDSSSTSEQVVFKSNYMGSITSGVIVPPNTINFDEIFDGNFADKVADNPAVLIVVVVISGLYLLLIIPVRKLDVQDNEQWDYKPILHNKPEDKFSYQISISISSRSTKLFTSPVFIVLYGSKGKTTPKHLDDCKRQLFKPGKLTNLLVTSSQDLGDLTHVHVWISAKDIEQNLHVQYINVHEPAISTSYTFLVNDWISTSIDEPECYGHEIYSINATEGKDFISLLKTNLTSKMFDDHLWLSVTRRPQKSNFTRVQRLSLCMSTLFLTMVVNAMWFPTDSTAEEDSPAVTIGPLRLTYRTFFVSIAGSLIVIPPNLFIMFFFRRSSPYRSSGRAKVDQEKMPVKAGDFENGCSKSMMSSSASIRPLTVNDPRDSMETPIQAEFDNSYLIHPPTVVTPDQIQAEQDNADKELRDKKKKRNKRFTLPWFGFIFGYILVGVCIFNGAWWCFLYSIQWGKEISAEWLSSLALSLFSSLLVIQPLKVILIATILTMFLEDSITVIEDSTQLNTVSEFYGRVEPLESIEPPVLPQKITATDPVLNLTQQKLYSKLMKKIKNTAAHFGYLVLLLIVVTHNQDKYFYYQNEAVKEIFSFSNIQIERLEGIYPNLRENIFPLIYPQVDYSGNTLSEYDQQFISNIMGYLMGPVRIKQYRESDVDCDMMERLRSGMDNKIHTCEHPTENRDWNINWNGTFNVGNFEDPAFIHDELEGAKIRGQISSYEQSGYSLEVQRYNWLRLITYLEEQVWIDKQTRAVTVEFVINNMNVNTWTQIKILYEAPNYGGVFVSSSVKSFRPYPFIDVMDFVFLVFYSIWALVLIYILVKQFIGMCKAGRTHLTDVWNLIEILNVILAFISIVLFILRALTVVKAVEFMMNNRNTYADFDEVMVLDESYSILMAFIIFISILQLLQPLDFSRQLTIIKSALSGRVHILITYTGIFTILLLCYSHTMYLAFGSQFIVFSEIFRSLYYLFGMLLGIIKYSDVIEEDTVILRIMFCFYMILGNLILLNLFVSVLCDGLAVMGEEEDSGFDEQLSEYINLKLTDWWSTVSGGHKRKSKRKRTGGLWNKELEVYHTIADERHQTQQLNHITLKEHYSKIKDQSTMISCWVPALKEEKLTEIERRQLPEIENQNRNEQLARLAIRTILMDYFILRKQKTMSVVPAQKKTSDQQKDKQPRRLSWSL